MVEVFGQCFEFYRGLQNARNRNRALTVEIVVALLIGKLSNALFVYGLGVGESSEMDGFEG